MVDQCVLHPSRIADRAGPLAGIPYTARDLGDLWGEADTLSRLGDTRHALGDPVSGRADGQRALDIFTALDHPDAAAVRAKLQLT
ncbi:hypothetical protein [Micromonospora hortensis]|uniref:hypothetical protein n=1 Tax=Micromonospora hortensis TaxID=2911209 RepID=UPI001EE79B22|nr:hypothetical protein [Micromonospora hortensis]MCG5449518.1 hypothetical protein [Micromonospora hortensis]